MRLKVRAYSPTYVAVSNRQVAATGEGIRAAGDDFEVTTKMNEDADVALVVSGLKHYHTRAQLYMNRKEIHERFKGRMITTESSLFRRNAQPHEGPDPYFRFSLGGFMRDDGYFHDGEPKPSDRWEMLRREQGLELLPWRTGGDYILVCMQKPSDASLRGLDIRCWTEEIVYSIRRYTSKPIVIRPHPLDPGRGEVNLTGLPGGVRWSKSKSIADDMAGALAVVTYTSLSAIESVMDGVPTFCMNKGNHAWDVSLQDLLFCLAYNKAMLNQDHRQLWVNGLAYSQWKLSELKTGEQWSRLRTQMLAGDSATVGSTGKR